jgi:hypothetical protein
MTNRLSSSARAYLTNLDLPSQPRGASFEAAPEFTGERQVVTVGAQLTEFGEAVSADLRKMIADGMLLAQLAADKEASKNPQDVFAWYNKYVEVLKNIGWLMKDLEFQIEKVDNSVVSLHRAIIPVIAAMLGAQVAVLPLVLNVLRGLEEMNKDSPWITLFDQSSQHAQGAKFQVGYVDANAQGEPQIVLVCFGIDARRRITQVLFLKSTADEATVKKGSTTLANTVDRLNASKDVIGGRVGPFINDFIKSVDI